MRRASQSACRLVIAFVAGRDAEPEHRRGDQRGGLGRVPPQLGGGRRSDQEGPLAAGPGGSQLLPEQ